MIATLIKTYQIMGIQLTEAYEFLISNNWISWFSIRTIFTVFKQKQGIRLRFEFEGMRSILSNLIISCFFTCTVLVHILSKCYMVKLPNREMICLHQFDMATYQINKFKWSHMISYSLIDLNWPRHMIDLIKLVFSTSVLFGVCYQWATQKTGRTRMHYKYIIIV